MTKNVIKLTIYTPNVVFCYSNITRSVEFQKDLLLKKMPGATR